jgi:hypothetical protein
VREPDETHDPLAVKVVRSNGKQVGYLPSGVEGGEIARRMDEGCRCIARVASVGRVHPDMPGGGTPYGMRIQVTFWNGSLSSQPSEEPELPPIEPGYDAAPTPPLSLEWSVSSPFAGLAILLGIAVAALVLGILLTR